MSPHVGVLALQGDTREHLAALREAGLGPITGPDDFATLTVLVAEERPRLATRKRELDAAVKFSSHYAQVESIVMELKAVRTKFTTLMRREGLL